MVLSRLIPIGVCSISLYYTWKWYNKFQKSLLEKKFEKNVEPNRIKEIFLNDNFFNGKFVLHLKGKTKNIPPNKIKNGVNTVFEYIEMVKESKQKLVIVWDGDDIKSGSFTEVIIKVNEKIDIETGNNCEFVYAMSHTNPYEVTTPKGLESIKAPVYNIIAGRGECTFDNILLEYINTYADKFRTFIFEDWNFINTAYYNDINEKEENWYKNLLNVKIKECQVKHRRNGHPYFTNNYGYLLLGLALVKLTGTKNVIYIDSGPVAYAEYSYLSMKNRITQIQL